MEIFAPAANTVLTQAEWQRLHFGEDFNDPGNETSIYGDLVDVDLDGIVNLLEFAFNLNPLEANMLAPISTASLSETGTPIIDLTFRRWREANGLTYIIAQNSA